MALIYNATFDKNTRKLSFEDKAGNEIYSFTVPERGPAVDDITKPLTFKAIKDGSTVKLTENGSPSGSFQTSRDGGNTWTDYTLYSAITINTGEEVSFRAKADRTTDQNSKVYFQFKMTGKIEAWHNVMSMYRTSDFATYESMIKYAFYYLFKDCTSLTKAPRLPATTLAQSCYYSMFSGCTSLTKAPELPATTLAGSCYYSMFSGCTSLTKAPALPATTLAGSCYSSMLSGCASLTEAPALPATTLADYCYQSMFYNCQKLAKAPELPATTLAKHCYYHMFDGCTSLTKAPELPATTLADNCYDNMFVGCTSLTKAPELPATTLTTHCYSNMFNGCTSLTEAPALPATTLASPCYLQMFEGCTSLIKAPALLPATTLTGSCYANMFKGCTSLTKAPELPATTLAGSCYTSMFSRCTSLTEAPVLPATTLADYCYQSMFYNCTSLTEAPALPATTLASSCYHNMFYGCTSLTKAPELPATTLANNCYKYMFNGCSSLNEVHCKMSSTISAEDIPTYTNNWLSNVSSTGTFYTNVDANWTSGASGIPEGWTRVNEETPTVNDITKPLTFKATQDGSAVKLAKYGSPDGAFQMSRDGGSTWTNYTTGTAITLNTGEEVSFRAKADRTSIQSNKNYFYFVMTGKIEAWHNVMSLYRTSDFATFKNVVECAFIYLFSGCTSLTKAPALPATTLANNCYDSMFSGCTSLTEAPALPATTLASNCYNSMFYGCTSLTEAPELPATTLANNCYQNMFNGCTSLTKAPELPATTLASSCYFYMFSGCSSLNEVHCDIPSSYSSSQISSYAKDWLSNVASTGTFYTNSDANWPSGASGIPTGWTRVPAVAPAVDNIRKPLTFKATQDGSSVRLTKNGSPDGSFQTSRDGGNTWTDYTIGTYINLNTGREVSFRAKADRTTDQTVQNYFYFEITGKIEAWHNVMSLYRKNVSATYSRMVSHAFYKLFSNCTSLTKAPKLPAITLAHSCYRMMFEGCTSLTEAPALPETTLAVACYWCMFYGCTSLTKAPELPATTLASSCYNYMFEGCTSLTKTPALSATTLADDCYQEMFKGCSRLNEVRCKIPSSYSSSSISSYAFNWLYGVSSKGTFYTNADANWPSGDDGIPQTWTRANIDDYPTT